LQLKPSKKLEFNMIYLSCIIAFIIGVAVGFVLSVITFFGKSFDWNIH